jgi:hypothetical protein
MKTRVQKSLFAVMLFFLFGNITMAQGILQGSWSDSYSWTDGTPTVSAQDALSGWWIPSATNGFRFTVPADATDKTLNLYIGGWLAFCDITATLSDGSAAELLNQDFTGGPDGDFNKFTINYKAGSAGQTLTISYSIPEQNHVNLKVFDMLGNEVVELVDGVKSPGNYEIEFNASNLSSGVYLYRIQAGQFSSLRKMVLLR